MIDFSKNLSHYQLQKPNMIVMENEEKRAKERCISCEAHLNYVDVTYQSKKKNYNLIVF